MNKYRAKPNKYRAVRVRIENHTFDSKREAAVYQQLKVLERAGEIEQLSVHQRMDLYAPAEAGMVKVGQYECDFIFWDVPMKTWRWVDVKGFDTPLSNWKRRHVKAQYGIEVEVWK